MNSNLKKVDKSQREVIMSSKGWENGLKNLSPTARRVAVDLDGTDKTLKKLTEHEGKFGNFFKNIGLSLLNSAIFTVATIAVTKIVEGISNYINRAEIAKKKTEEMVGVWESTKEEISSLGTELETTSSRIDELHALQAKGGSAWNDTLANELTTLELQNAALETQIALAKEKAEIDKENARLALESEIETANEANRYTSAVQTNTTGAIGAFGAGGEGVTVAKQVDTETYVNESLQKLKDLREIKKQNNELTADELLQYNEIRKTLNGIGTQYSEWASKGISLGLDEDEIAQYAHQAELIADALERTQYEQVSKKSIKDKLADSMGGSRGLGGVLQKWQDGTSKDFLSESNQSSSAYQILKQKADEYGVSVEYLTSKLRELGYFQGDVTKSSEDAIQPLSNLSNALKALKTDTADLETAIGAISSSNEDFGNLFSVLNDDEESEFLNSLLSAFPQLKDEILAYNDAIAAGGDKLVAQTKLQQEMNAALNQFRADKLVEGVENIASAAEAYGKNSHSVIEAIEELDSIIPGLSNTLIDENGVLRDNAIAALTSADGLLACVEANKSLGLAAAQLDLSNAKKQLDDLGTSASMAAIRLAESAVITAQLNLDKTKESIEAMLGNVGKPKSSGKSSKDHLLESYQAEIARLDHLREMDQINEATYYNDKLAALQTYLKDRKKYQEQWWAWEEEFHKYQKQLIEDEIDRLEDARDDQIDANEEYYKARKKQEEDAYEAEKDRVDKVIDELDRELDAKKKSIQKQRDLLDEQADDREYNKSIEQKNKEIADIKAQLTVLDLDDSAGAKAKKIALQEELTDKLNDLEDYQYDHSVDTQKNALDKQETYWEDHFGKLIEAQELYLENLKTMYDQTIESIESSMEAMTNSIKASFDSLIAAQQSLLNNAGSIPGMAEITPIGGGSGDDKPGSNEYKVKKGDNLSRIAKAKGTSVSKLLELNPWIKDKNKIYPGQIIKYHDGGVVGKSINDKDKEVLSQLVPVSRDEVLAKLLRGEVVVNEKQQGLMRDAWMSIVPSMALATKQADMAKALASNVTTNNSPNIVFDMKIELGNTDAAGLTALQRQLENFKNEAVKAVYERMSNHRQKTGRINPSGRY